MFETPMFEAKLIKFTAKKNETVGKDGEPVRSNNCKLTFMSSLEQGSPLYNEVNESLFPIEDMECKPQRQAEISLKYKTKELAGKNRFVVRLLKKDELAEDRLIAVVNKAKFSSKFDFTVSSDEDITDQSKVEFTLAVDWKESLDLLSEIEGKTITLYVEPDDEALGVKPNLDNVTSEDGIYFEDALTAEEWSSFDSNKKLLLSSLFRKEGIGTEERPVTSSKISMLLATNGSRSITDALQSSLL